MKTVFHFSLMLAIGLIFAGFTAVWGEDPASSLPDKLPLPGSNGVYGGVDDLRRVLPVGDSVSAPRCDRYVGLFYFLWLAQHGNDGPYDITKIVREHPEAVDDVNHPAWGELPKFHHWGESIFGYYTSDDDWVKRKHVQMLTDAGVDFLIVDATNATDYHDQAVGLMKILDEYQKQGWNVPKMVFYTNSASGATIEKIYQGIYKPNLYPNLWFYWEGKPLIVGHPEECNDELKNFFRIKKSQWPNEGKYHADGFPWIAFERPQHVFKNAQGENEVVNVAVAQHNGTIRFSSSAFYGDQTNWTRSFHDGKNDPAEGAYKYGYNFIEQFDFAIKQDPKIIFVTGWNEWIAMRFQGPNKKEPVMFVDLCDTNNSRDIEPMVGGFGDNYFLQMIDYIRKYKGAAPIQKGGNLNNPAVYHDYVNDVVDRNAKGYGDLVYTNTTGRNDLATMTVSCDKENFTFSAATVDPITSPTNHWMSLFLRIKPTENKNWEGYDFVINRVTPEDGKAVLEQSEGGWNWKKVGNVTMKLDGNKLQLTVPRKLLGLDQKPSQFEFKWADNYQGEGDITSFYRDGDAAPIGRLNYVFQE